MGLSAGWHDSGTFTFWRGLNGDEGEEGAVCGIFVFYLLRS